jgi:hypothetical protein
MPERTERLRQLYEKAKRAFAAAGEAAATHPAPGSPEWQRWQELCQDALDANAEYLRELGKLKPLD